VRLRRADLTSLAADAVRDSLRSGGASTTRRKWISPKTMMWSKHSSRIHPISRSAKPFCQGEAGAVGLSRTPMARNRRDNAAIDPVAIADEVVRSLIPRKCLRYLTGNPFCRRVGCDVDPDEVSPVEPDDDEGIEQVETDSWDDEQVHGSNVWRVVMQEGPGRISVLMRGRGMKRCRAEGAERFALFVGAAVLANNLMIIGGLAIKRSRRRRKPKPQ
jgi:hypothetical protein